MARVIRCDDDTEASSDICTAVSASEKKADALQKLDKEFLTQAMQSIDPELRDWVDDQLTKNKSLKTASDISGSKLPRVVSYTSTIDSSSEEPLPQLSNKKYTLYEINELSSSQHSDVSEVESLEKATTYSFWESSEMTRKSKDVEAKNDALYASIIYSAKPIEKLLKTVRPPKLDWRSGNDQPCQPRNVNEISREPIYCPHCAGIISPSALMSHFITQHNDNDEVFFIEVHLNHRCLLVFEPMKFVFDKVMALSLLAYGGSKSDSNANPIRRGNALPNTSLPSNFAKYQDYTPVVLLMCRTSWAAIFGSKELYDAFNSKRKDDTSDIWVIWLATTQLIKPLHATITVYNRYLAESLSRIVRVRTLADSQKCSEFMKRDFNFLDISYGNVKSLSHNFSEPISMEIIFNEF